ncbi:MAG: DUF1015 domain-containing protein [Anaerolineaceae bacterium]|jgi:hypothetical protein
MKNYPDVGIQIPQILLPKPGTDLTKWAVIACDQFTSEPEYWHQVEQIVGKAPSTYDLILPEVFLGTPQESIRIQASRQAMQKYLGENLLEAHDGMVMVERSIGGKTRQGLLLALDLERYDFNPGSQSLIRATEGTILERLPPRIKIRQGAPLELPHILVLIDDPHCTVIEPLLEKRRSLQTLYDFELMLGSGHLKGSLVSNPDLQAQVIRALEQLADPHNFSSRYNVGNGKGVLLFAMGDGNHSLATAKAIWDKIRLTARPDHPARYALVEIENVHDDALNFEPIHRVLFNVTEDVQAAMQRHYGADLRFLPCADQAEMINQVSQPPVAQQAVGVISAAGYGIVIFSRPTSNLPVGTLQPFLDNWLKQSQTGKIDYIHGDEIVYKLGTQKGNLAFYLPAMPKKDLFKTIVLDGMLPRKTFSMGEAKEKRFYMEARRID